MEYYCRYALINKNGNFVAPPKIKDGGFILEKSNNVSELVLLGKIEGFTTKSTNLPEGILEIISTKVAISLQKTIETKNKKDKELAARGKLFDEAFAKLRKGNKKMWIEFLENCEE